MQTASSLIKIEFNYLLGQDFDNTFYTCVLEENDFSLGLHSAVQLLF